MRIKLHDDVEGHKSGETVDVEETRAKWYLANGYASAASYNDDEHPEMGVLAKHDPMLADNVKAKPNDGLRDQMAAGLGTRGEADPDPIKPRTEPIERTNGKGNPEKAEAGKARVEDKAADTDPADAPEADADLVDERAKVADAAEKKAVKADEAGAKAADDTSVTTDAASDPAQKAATKARGGR